MWESEGIQLLHPHKLIVLVAFNNPPLMMLLCFCCQWVITDLKRASYNQLLTIPTLRFKNHIGVGLQPKQPHVTKKNKCNHLTIKCNTILSISSKPCNNNDHMGQNLTIPFFLCVTFHLVQHKLGEALAYECVCYHKVWSMSSPFDPSPHSWYTARHARSLLLHHFLSLGSLVFHVSH